MNNTQLFARYQSLQRYVGWTTDDADRVRAAGSILDEEFDELIVDFYAELERHPAALAVITGGPEQIERLKGTLRTWLSELFVGDYGREYVERRRRVGQRHVEIGLEQVYTNVALARLRGGLLGALGRKWRGKRQELVATVQSLNKLLDLDLAIIEDAYHFEHVARRQREERARRSVRLAAIGEMIAGLAHESRNALQRIQACAETLELEVEDRPAARELVHRIIHAQEHLHRLYDEVRNYAGPIQLDLDQESLGSIWREAWELLVPQRQGRQTRLVDLSGRLDLHCRVDRFRLSQVFRNVLENSLAACEDPVEIEIVCREAELSGAAAIEVCVRDNGPGFEPHQQERVFQPFYTTKAKGTGLGMSIAQRIVEAHGGRIAAQNTIHGGAEIMITLPR